MAEYHLPYHYTTKWSGAHTFLGLRHVRTYGKRLAPKMDPWQKTSKKRLNNPVLWAQLDAVTKEAFVNHLGRRHTRRVEDRP